MWLLWQAEDAGREVESLASSLTQTEMVQYLKNNPTLVTSMKNILKESFAGNLPYRSLAGAVSDLHLECHPVRGPWGREGRWR